MGFTFGYCNRVRARRVYLHRIARDGLNASNCADVAVESSDFAWIIDDCLAVNLSAGAAGDRGQQRAVRFVGNRVYNAQGVKVLGGRHVLIAGNSVHAPLNYAVYVGSDPSYGEGARPIEDVLVYANTVTDLVTAEQFGCSAVVDTGILVSQHLAGPNNVVIRGNGAGAADGDRRPHLVGAQAARHCRRQPASSRREPRRASAASTCAAISRCGWW